MEALIEELVPPIQGIIHLGIYATSNIYIYMHDHLLLGKK
jgi:hypothetical protein